MKNSPSKEIIECVVIGAGVVGLAIARAYALLGKDILIIESQSHIGTGISARNSEVIHAGIYYPSGSLKAKLCVRGRDLLYSYLRERGLAHQQCAKIIVATHDAQITTLENIEKRAISNGVHDLKGLSSSEASTLEPSLYCTQALLSPSTGIIDTHSFMLCLQGDIEDHGGRIAFLTTLNGASVCDNGIDLRVNCQGEDMILHAKTVINAAGLGAINIARHIEGLAQDTLPQLRYAKGNYFKLMGKHPFRHLIYPVPEDSGLGVHLTLDLAGQARFGPDVEWVETLDYHVNPTRADGFYKAIRSYWPDLPDESLIPDYSGIRPKLYLDGNPYTDFMIQGENDHEIAGLTNLFGIESPGLTASLAIAEYVTQDIII
ncbi:MAG: FAD-dependent oxidoreductase [Zetaproteobacteria bacterium]|nr:MAG: FAD-dependent oxidoreductase [Zetaproteobacteria bacterium]